MWHQTGQRSWVGGEAPATRLVALAQGNFTVSWVAQERNGHQPLPAQFLAGKGCASTADGKVPCHARCCCCGPAGAVCSGSESASLLSTVFSRASLWGIDLPRQMNCAGQCRGAADASIARIALASRSVQHVLHSRGLASLCSASVRLLPLLCSRLRSLLSTCDRLAM